MVTDTLFTPTGGHAQSLVSSYTDTERVDRVVSSLHYQSHTCHCLVLRSRQVTPESKQPERPIYRHADLVRRRQMKMPPTSHIQRIFLRLSHTERRWQPLCNTVHVYVFDTVPQRHLLGILFQPCTQDSRQIQKVHTCIYTHSQDSWSHVKCQRKAIYKHVHGQTYT